MESAIEGKSRLYYLIRSSEDNFKVHDMNTRSKTKNIGNEHQMGTDRQAENDQVSDEAKISDSKNRNAQIDINGSTSGVAEEIKDKVELKVGNKYIIASDFNGEDENEIQVKRGEIVVLEENTDPTWCVVRSLGTKKRGAIQQNLLQKYVPVAKVENGSSQSFITFLNQSFGKNCILVLLAVLVVSVLSAVDLKKYFSNETECASKRDIECLNFKINQLGKKYTFLPENIWSTLSYCLETTLDNKQPCIILMLNGGHQDFSYLLDEFGRLSVYMLQNPVKNDNVSIIPLKGSDLVESSIDNFFTDHKCKLMDHKVMLVNEMESIPGRIMELFHSFCDVYDPAVKQAVIIFLLNHKHIKVDPGSNDASLANNILSELWKNSIKPDLINPLSIRVSENIINLDEGK